MKNFDYNRMKQETHTLFEAEYGFIPRKDNEMKENYDVTDLYNIEKGLFKELYKQADYYSENIKRATLVKEDGQLKLRDEYEKYVSLDTLHEIMDALVLEEI